MATANGSDCHINLELDHMPLPTNYIEQALLAHIIA